MGMRFHKAESAFFVFITLVLAAGVILAHAYELLSASVAAILNETSSVFIVLLAWLVLREALTRRRVSGVVFTLAGVACMLV